MEKATPTRKTFEVLQSPQQEYGYEYQRQNNNRQNEVKGPEMRPTFVSTGEGRYNTKENLKSTDVSRFTDRKKFMRYTNEGYVEPSKQEKKQEDNLKWR